jgi:hypothetical protein
MNARVLPVVAIAALSCVAFAQQLPEIYRPDPKEKDPWADVALHIESLTCDTQSQCTVRARGVHHGESVGLEVVVGAIDGRRRGISYRSIGEESNRFLRALAELYKAHARMPAMKASTFADAVVLSGNLSTMQSQRVDIKVFFYADGPESKYAELYTNVDPVRGVLEIHEKDPDYRENVIKALAK